MNVPPIYLDDCIYRKLLVSLLRQHGYVVRTPVQVSLARQMLSISNTPLVMAMCF